MCLWRALLALGYFLEKLNSRLKHNARIIEGAMHLHKFLVDYRNRLASPDQDNAINRSIFVNDMCDNGISSVVIRNDNYRVQGRRPNNDEHQHRLQGANIRESLKLQLTNHSMYRKKGNDVWEYDETYHIQSI